MNVDIDPLLCGDIYFRLMHKGGMNGKLICRFALNTCFIQNNVYEFTKSTVDPDSTVKDPRISWDFKIECYFKDFFCSTALGDTSTQDAVVFSHKSNNEQITLF